MSIYNKTIVQMIKNKMNDGLAKLDEKHHLLFKRMYSPDNLDRSLEDIVANFPPDKLDNAYDQIERTLIKLGRV